MNELKFKSESYLIIGKCIEVHRTLGHGFLEAVYKDALEHEFNQSEIPFCREQQFGILYKDVLLRKKYIADFTVFDKIILEIKAIDGLTSEHAGQAINYLKVRGYELCLLVNFGRSFLEFKRYVL